METLGSARSKRMLKRDNGKRKACYAVALCMLNDCILQSYIKDGALPCDHTAGASQVIPERPTQQSCRKLRWNDMRPVQACNNSG